MQTTHLHTKHTRALLQSAKYSTDCFLKYRKWNLRDTGKAKSEFSIEEILAESIRNYEDAAPGVQTTNWSPLHLAALMNDVPSLQFLLENKGLDIDTVYTTPSQSYPLTPLVCAAYSGGIEAVEFLTNRGADMFKYARSLIHWTVKGGNIACLTCFLEADVLCQKPLDLCSLIVTDVLGDNVDILKVILKYHPKSAFDENRSRETTVYLAARKGLKNVLKQLITCGVSVNKRDKFQLTTLHAAILNNFTDDAAFKCIQILLENGASPNYEKSDRAPLYHAALRGFSQCVFELIKYGAVINVETLAILNEKIPNFFQSHLDGLVTLQGLSNSYSKMLVSINLRFTGTLNARHRNMRETSFLNFLITDGQHKFLHHPVIETYLTVKWIFVRKFFLASILSYVIMLIFFSWFAMKNYVDQANVPLVVFRNNSSNNESINLDGDREHIERCSCGGCPYNLLWCLSLIAVLLRATMNTLRLLINPRGYISKTENWIQWVLLIGIVIVHIPLRNEKNQCPEWQSTTAAIVVFGSWAFLLNYIRRQPDLGIYVEMLYKVITNLLKLMLTFVTILIGFAISFMILYKGDQPFATPTYSMLRVLNMMVGEMGFDTMFVGENDSTPKENANKIEMRDEDKAENAHSHSTVIHILYVLFVFTISIALINLLIGLAVSDIKGLRKRSKLNKTLREIAFIVDLEEFIFSRNVNYILPKRVSKYLSQCIQLPATQHALLDPTIKSRGRETALPTTTPTAFTKVKDAFKKKSEKFTQLGDMHKIHIYPNDANDKRLHKGIKHDALQIAIRNSLIEEGKIEKQEKIEAQLASIQAQLDFLVKRKEGIH